MRARDRNNVFIDKLSLNGLNELKSAECRRGGSDAAVLEAAKEAAPCEKARAATKDECFEH